MAEEGNCWEVARTEFPDTRIKFCQCLADLCDLELKFNSRLKVQGGSSCHGLSYVGNKLEVAHIVVVVVDLMVKRNFKFNVNIR